MRRVTNYTISKESLEDMCEARRFNPCLAITFRDRTGEHTHKLSAGHSDIIHVYREHTETFVLSENSGLGYFGLEVFNSSEKAGDIFLESHQVKEILCRDDLTPFTVIRRLGEYVNP